MKKLVIAAFALCAAYGAQAMAVQWKVSGSSTFANYNAYLIVGDTVKSDWASVADIAAASSDGAHALSQSSGPNKYTGTVITKDDTLSKSGKFYYVIVKADNSQFAVSSTYAGSSYVYDDKANPPESAPGISSWTATSATFKNFQSVPEPTSAMLLLLGMAGLALKRKRA